uniref:Thioredoxin domain-containing protein n=1 Tax=Arcella intermedia TaxID=1963864 RepID=A0A6B2L6K7_9EUKA
MVDLTEANFNETTKEGRWILDFYAPWCPHCQKLKPILENAHFNIQNEAPQAQLNFGLVDCTVEKELSARFGIQGYPTLKFARKGKVIDYTGGRAVADFVDFAKQFMRPAVRTLGTAQEVQELMESYAVVFVLVAESYEVIEDFVELWRIQGKVGFGWTSDRNLLQNYIQQPANYPGLYLFNDNPVKKYEVYDRPFEKEEMEEWMTFNAYPLFNEYDFNNWRALSSDRKAVIAVADPTNNDHKAFLETIKIVAAKFKDAFVFGYFDMTKYHRYISQFRLEEYPGVVVFDVPKDIFYKSERTHKTEQDVSDFLEAVLNDKIEPQGGGSGVGGKLQQIGDNLYWQFKDHPYLFGGMTLLVVLIFALIFFITTSDTDEPEPESKKQK